MCRDWSALGVGQVAVRIETLSWEHGHLRETHVPTRCEASVDVYADRNRRQVLSAATSARCVTVNSEIFVYHGILAGFSSSEVYDSDWSTRFTGVEKRRGTKR